MSEEFGLKEFERFRVVLQGDEDEAEERLGERFVSGRGRTFAGRVTEPVLADPGGETWLKRAEQTLVFVKRLYRTRA
jgi:hypothetical protein